MIRKKFLAQLLEYDGKSINIAYIHMRECTYVGNKIIYFQKIYVNNKYRKNIDLVNISTTYQMSDRIIFKSNNLQKFRCVSQFYRLDYDGTE